jgi:glutaredoxin-related protein
MLFKKDTPKLPQSRFNRRLVGILREHSIAHDFLNLLADEDVRQGVKKFAEWPTFPQLWVGGLYIVSLSDLSNCAISFLIPCFGSTRKLAPILIS